MVKRLNEDEPQASVKKLSILPTKLSGFKNEYNGYYPDVDTIETIKLEDVDAELFYKRYISTRKPVIIEGVIPEINVEEFQLDRIVDKLKSDDLLLVEKRYKGGFGSGTDRIKMTFEEFMGKVQGEGGDDYYLTTQYAEDDPDTIERTLQDDLIESESEDESDTDIAPVWKSSTATDKTDDFSDEEELLQADFEDDFLDSDPEVDGPNREDVASEDVPNGILTKEEANKRVQELVQKPLINLIKAKSLPLRPTLFEKLFPQQINLWIGSANPTNDESFKSDNDKVDYGLGKRVFGGGASSGLHHDHADNLYIPIKGAKRFTIFSPKDADKMSTVGNISHVYDSGIIDYQNNENAPGWRSLRSDSAILTEVARWKLDSDLELSLEEAEQLQSLIDEEEEKLIDFEKKVIDSQGIKKDPPSFSKVPPSIVHINKIKDETLRAELLKFGESKWPQFFKAKRMTGYLKPGQMLYLPTGWFHEVTSFGDNPQSKTHIALNYWFSPPDDMKKVYQDKYWEEDFERTSKSCEYFASLP